MDWEIWEELLPPSPPLDEAFATDIGFVIMDDEGPEASNTSIFPKLDEGWLGFVGYLGVIKLMVLGTDREVCCLNRCDDCSIDPNTYGCSSAVVIAGSIEVAPLEKGFWNPDNIIGEEFNMGIVIGAFPIHHLALATAITSS